MSLRRIVACALPALALASCCVAHADSTVLSGSFTADNNVVSNPFSVTSAQNYTFATTSAAGGNFLPVLTLFNSVTGAPIDASDSGFGDVSLTDTLSSGSYVLDITEFPNVANGSLTDGFLFGSDPTATGDACGGSLTGQSFINAETCSAMPLGKSYTVDVTSTAVTPEPSTFLLMLAPAAGLIQVVRRRRLA